MTPCQQYELYASERPVDHGKFYQNKKDAQAFIDSLRDNQWWEDEYPQVVRVEVRFISRPDSVGVWEPENHGGVMEMAPIHRCELILLHELAHILADARYGSQAHCPWFARTYLELVYRVMGSETYQQLYTSFNENQIEHVI